MKFCLKAPKSDDKLEKLSTGNLKRNPSILHGIFTHVLRPRKGGHSRIDQSEVHLMYILENKMLICCPYYFVYRTFTVRECNR